MLLSSKKKQYEFDFLDQEVRGCLISGREFIWDGKWLIGPRFDPELADTNPDIPPWE